MSRGNWRREATLLLGVAAALAAVLGAVLTLRPVSTCVLGDAGARAAGVIPERLRARHFDSARMRAGLGSAAGDWAGLGDALAVNGRLWARTTDRRADHYYRAIAVREFATSHFVYVPTGHAPADRFAPAGGTLRELATELVRRYPGGAIAAGYVRFAQLNTIAIGAPPIGGLAVTRNAARYYTRPLESSRDSWAYVVLLAGRRTTLASDELHRRLLAPTGGRDATLWLAHALRLRAPPPDTAQGPLEADVVALGQVVDGSVLDEGALDLFPMTRVEDCAD